MTITLPDIMETNESDEHFKSNTSSEGLEENRSAERPPVHKSAEGNPDLPRNTNVNVKIRHGYGNFCEKGIPEMLRGDIASSHPPGAANSGPILKKQGGKPASARSSKSKKRVRFSNYVPSHLRLHKGSIASKPRRTPKSNPILVNHVMESLRRLRERNGSMISTIVTWVKTCYPKPRGYKEDYDTEIRMAVFQGLTDGRLNCRYGRVQLVVKRKTTPAAASLKKSLPEPNCCMPARPSRTGVRHSKSKIKSKMLGLGASTKRSSTSRIRAMRSRSSASKFKGKRSRSRLSTQRSKSRANKKVRTSRPIKRFSSSASRMRVKRSTSKTKPSILLINKDQPLPSVSKRLTSRTKANASAKGSKVKLSPSSMPRLRANRCPFCVNGTNRWVNRSKSRRKASLSKSRMRAQRSHSRRKLKASPSASHPVGANPSKSRVSASRSKSRRMIIPSLPPSSVKVNRSNSRRKTRPTPSPSRIRTKRSTSPIGVTPSATPPLISRKMRSKSRKRGYGLRLPCSASRLRANRSKSRGRKQSPSPSLRKASRSVSHCGEAGRLPSKQGSPLASPVKSA